AWSDQVVTSHNKYRTQYGASPVTWNSALYSSTLSYGQSCKFSHRHEQLSFCRYGENLYAGTGDVGINDALQAWMGEACKWSFLRDNNPGFSSSTGHFTQVVWKSTTEVSCAIADCPAGTIFPGDASKFIICRYTPPGNVQGQFPSVTSITYPLVNSTY
ncbi:hypothetical protein M413DRAFT_73815, partial [Hebeloma cylindrosporum]